MIGRGSMYVRNIISSCGGHETEWSGVEWEEMSYHCTAKKTQELAMVLGLTGLFVYMHTEYIPYM